MNPAPDMVHTHEAALALLHYAVPGARVRAWPLRPDSAGSHRTLDASRAYAIEIFRHGRPAVVLQGCYSLPASSVDLANDARRQADKALRDG